jgi:GT2 family glycosyltransferase
MQGIAPVDKARNQVVQFFLATNYDWLIMIDNDIIPPEHFLRVISAAEEDGKFVVGLPYPIIKESAVLMCVGNKTEDPRIVAMYNTAPSPSWTKVDYAGTGLIAIRRCVLEKVKSPWFAFQEMLSEDFDFCSKAAASGFQIWTNGDYVCDHLHTCSLLQVLAMQGRAAQKDMASAIDAYERMDESKGRSPDLKWI